MHPHCPVNWTREKQPCLPLSFITSSFQSFYPCVFLPKLSSPRRESVFAKGAKRLPRAQAAEKDHTFASSILPWARAVVSLQKRSWRETQRWVWSTKSSCFLLSEAHCKKGNGITEIRGFRSKQPIKISNVLNSPFIHSQRHDNQTELHHWHMREKEISREILWQQLEKEVRESKPK